MENLRDSSIKINADGAVSQTVVRKEVGPKNGLEYKLKKQPWRRRHPDPAKRRSTGWKVCTLEDKKKIIELRFGMVGNNVENQRQTYQRIAAKVRVTAASVRYQVGRYIERGYTIDEEPYRNHGKKQVLSAEQQAWVVAKKQSLEWLPLPLAQRCVKIQDKFGVKISPSTLGRLYRRFNLRWLVPKYTYNSSRQHRDELELQKDFICRFCVRQQLGKSFCYLDETTVNLWQSSPKIWRPRNDPAFKYHLPAEKGAGITIIAMIDEEECRIRYMFADSSSIENVQNFIVSLQQDHKEKVIVLDNAGGHNVDTVYFTEAGLEPLWLPPNASFLNPIERLFSWIKARWGRRLLECRGEMTQGRIKTELKAIIDGCPPEVIFNIAHGRFKTYEHLLKYGYPDCF